MTTSLVLMYVYYDKNGDIKAITPALDEGLAAVFSIATFPLYDVEGFLKSEKNTFDYQVKKIEKLNGVTYKLAKKFASVNYTRTLDNYLTKIEPVSRKNNVVVIVNNTITKTVSIELSMEFKNLYHDGTDEEQDTIAEFLNRGSSIVYMTSKDNPYELLFSFTFSPKDLFNAERLYFPYEGEYTNVSFYTKKLIAGYGYKERTIE